MKNSLSDLNNYLFAEIERINSDDLKGEELDAEIKRAKTMAGLSEAIIHNADVQLKAVEMRNNYDPQYYEIPQNILPAKQKRVEVSYDKK